MQVGSIIEANRALASAGGRAALLEGASIPRLFDRAPAITAARELLTAAAQDADHAATTLVGAGGFPPESVESIRAAARLLRTTKPRQAAIREAGAALAASLDQARASYASGAARDSPLLRRHMAELVGRESDRLSIFDWGSMRNLLDADPSGTVLGGPRRLDGLDDLRAIADRNARSSMYGQDARIVASNRYLASWRLGEAPAPRIDAARALAERDPAEFARGDWQALLTVLDSDPDGTVLRGARRLEGVQPIRDVVAQRIKATSREMSLVTERDHAAVRRYFTHWSLEGRPDEERAGLLRALVARDPASLDLREWSTLHALLERDPGVRGPLHLTGLIRFDEIAAKNAARPLGEKSMRSTRSYFDAWRLAGSPAEQRASIARSLVARDPAELTPADWTNLRTILDSDPHDLVLRAPRQIGDLRPFRDLVSDGADRPLYSAGGLYQLNRYLSAWRSEMDPDYPAKLAVAIEEVATSGTPSRASRRLVAAEGHRLAELVEGRPASEQAAIAIEMLDTPGIAATRGVWGTLEMLRAGAAEATGSNPGIETVRAQTMELIDRNLSRLDGVTPEGAVQGFGRHPDYAEIGRIRANLMLLDQLDRAARAPTPTPTPAAVERLAW